MVDRWQKDERQKEEEKSQLHIESTRGALRGMFRFQLLQLASLALNVPETVIGID